MADVKEWDWVINRHQPTAPVAGAGVLTAAGLAAAKAEITAWPDYAPTPLHDLAGLAGALGFARLFYKDESARFTLRSFKALGGAYAVIRQAQAFLKTRLGET
ncbi:MAG: hypothetical protein VX168_03125, partial [Pseudomonadota bacterium]|nr:hypothetical protein [Pseudomonadota bacterium]